MGNSRSAAYADVDADGDLDVITLDANAAAFRFDIPAGLFANTNPINKQSRYAELTKLGTRQVTGCVTPALQTLLNGINIAGAIWFGGRQVERSLENSATQLLRSGGYSDALR